MRNENNRCISVYVPDSLENNNVGFLPGFIQKDGSNVKFYITDDKLRDVRTGCIGYCGLAHMESNQDRPNYWIRVSFSDGQFQVSHILCDGVQEYKLLYVFYDYRSFKKSNVILVSQKTKDDFYILSKTLEREKRFKHQSFVTNFTIARYLIPYLYWFSDCCRTTRTKLPPIIYSSTFVHIENNVNLFRTILEDVNRKRGISLQIQNILVSKVLDIIVGLIVLNWINEHKEEITSLLTESTETVVNRIAELLRFLMGSPVGLKLNNAFNKTLGKFFLYHLSLWNSFLTASTQAADLVWVLIYFLSTFGFTYQIALVSDIFTLATFHVYCIYVYAARLYGVQIYGLIALWRLFLGRKHNPLKDRVDTYHYNSHQLFIGTLAFSILLFLLPTTAVYYLVFVSLRLSLLLISKIFESILKIIQDFPVYLTLLWATNSPKIKGDVHISVTPTRGALAVKATVKAGSWSNCCRSVSKLLPIPKSAKENGKKTLVHMLINGHLI